MSPITDATRIAHYRELVRKMMLSQDGNEYEFSPVFIREHGWKVIPAESAMRLPPGDIPRITSALRGGGCFECIAVISEAGYLQPLRPGNEQFDKLETCYRLSAEESDFLTFNRKLGVLRSVLTDDSNSWAISCNESYNLFAGNGELVEALLGKPVEQARKDFLEFASTVARGDPDEPLIRAAARFASL